MKFSFLNPAPHKPLLDAEKIDPTYKKLRFQVFLGIFLGYAGYYLVRKNFALAMPDLLEQGYSKADLGWALSGVSIASGLSKFLMGNVSYRSDARKFLTTGVGLAALTMMAVGKLLLAISSMRMLFVLYIVYSWFQGMGWCHCGRVVVHCFSVKERGSKMSIWNVAHNVGGGLIGPLA